MPVITIARQFGAGGEAVGQILARRLGANLLDRSLIAEIGRRLQLTPAEVEARDEQPEGFLEQLLKSLGSNPLDLGAPGELPAWTPPHAELGFDTTRAVLGLTQQLIREAAATGSAVIVGRGGAYVLADHPGSFHVFLVGSASSRARYAVEHLGLTEEQAAKQLKQQDANRGAYIRQVYGHDWSSAVHYDLVVNTGTVGVEGAAEVVLASLSAVRPR